MWRKRWDKQIKILWEKCRSAQLNSKKLISLIWWSTWKHFLVVFYFVLNTYGVVISLHKHSRPSNFLKKISYHRLLSCLASQRAHFHLASETTRVHLPTLFQISSSLFTRRYSFRFIVLSSGVSCAKCVPATYWKLIVQWPNVVLATPYTSKAATFPRPLYWICLHGLFALYSLRDAFTWSHWRPTTGIHNART